MLLIGVGMFWGGAWVSWFFVCVCVCVVVFSKTATLITKLVLSEC